MNQSDKPKEGSSLCLYDIELKSLESAFDTVRRQYEKKFKPIIEAKVKELHFDICSTQAGVSVSHKENETKAFTALQNFIHSVGDDYGIELLFEIHNGKFIWYK